VTPGNVELVQVVASMVVCTGGVAAVLGLDERRLTREQLDRAWAPVTRDAAVLGAFLFGILYGGPALLVHFVRTRRSLRGVGLGFLWMVALLAADLGAQLLSAAAVDRLGL
jgi:hypothetical protein